MSKPQSSRDRIALAAVERVLAQKLSFDDWKREADKVCQAKTGMSLDDLPDVPFMDWYEEGVTPAGAAGRAIRSAKSDGY